MKKTGILFLIVFGIQSGYAQTANIKIITNSPLAHSKPGKNCSEIAICNVLKKHIESARETIDFSIYGFRKQPWLLRALAAAQQRGVQIRGIVDKDIHKSNYYSDTHLLEAQIPHTRNDYSHDLKIKQLLARKHKNFSAYEKCKRPANTEGPLQCFQGKSYAGEKKFTFRGDIMHNKFFIVDDRFVWTGSANLSDTGTGGYNANVVAAIHSQEIAAQYTQEFEQMFIQGDFHRSKQVHRKVQLETCIQQSCIQLYFSPQGYAVKRGILPLLAKATKSIDVAIFFLTHNEIALALKEAHQRGVSVRVILDATGAQNSYSKHQFLRDNGILVKVENWGSKMHMKAAVVDNKDIIIGSMNWTKAGERKNDENTLIIRDQTELSSLLSGFYQELWQSIPARWLSANPDPESLDSIGACFDGIDNDFDRQIDQNDPDCQAEKSLNF